MIFKPHNNGRLAAGNTPWGDYRVEWDADGNLISHSITIKTPQPNLAPNLPDDPAEIERIKNQERKRRSCCDPPEGVK